MITVLGSINMDLIANVPRLPKPGETISGDRFTTAAGGKGANQALAARRAGAKVQMVGACGEDEFAGPALTYLRYEGVDLTRVRSAATATGVALIFVGGDGENVIAIVPGANGTVSAEDAEQAVKSMARGDILMVQMEIPASANEAALVAARQKGVTTILNTAPFTSDTKSLMSLADIVIANETEFGLFSGSENASLGAIEKNLKEMHAASKQTIIVTLGAEGAIAIHKGELITVDSLKVDPVDTVGAGDTFCGYLAAGIDQKLDFKVALRRAAAAGSLACTKEGAQPSIPFASDVARRLS